MDENATTPLRPAAITVFDIHYSAGRRKIINGVSFEIRRGESYLVLASNGAGKTTLLKILAGMLTPDSGRVLVDGHDLSEITPGELQDLRLRMRFVFEDGVLMSNLTLQENVSLPLFYHTKLDNDAVRQRVQEEMARLKILEYASEYPPAVDRSVRRRAQIAAALMLPPDILFIDSPVVGFDTDMANLVMRRIMNLKEERKTTLVMASHTLEMLAGLTDSLGVLEGGKMAHSGTLERIVGMLKMMEDSRVFNVGPAVRESSNG